MFALLLAAAVARPPVPGLHPTFQVVEVKNGVIGWTEPRTTTVNEAVTKTRTVERNGRRVQETYLETQAVPRTFLHAVTVGKDATFQTAAGRPLTYAQAAESLLRRPVAVLYTGQGEPIRTYLTILRDDAVVVRWAGDPAAVPLP